MELEVEMLAKTERTLMSFALALMIGFYFTTSITGSVDLAFERMIIIVAIWVICALARWTLCTLAGLFARITYAISKGPRGQEPTPDAIGHRLD